MSFKFEKLEVWQRALEFTYIIHELTKDFPKSELYILTSQIKRATDSITLNIAEGSTGQSNAEFKRFLNIAIRSAIEVVACLYIGKRRNIVENKIFNELYSELEIIVKMIYGLRNSL